MSDKKAPTTKAPAEAQAATYQSLNRLTQETLGLFIRRATDAMSRSGTTELDASALQHIADRMAGGKDPALPKVYERN